MPLQKLELRPGVNRESTTYANEGGFYACDKVRFRSGFAEKIGGWVNQSTYTFSGVCRSLFNWISTVGDNLLGVGTNQKFYVELNGVYHDITPLQTTDTYLPNNPFATVSGSYVVTVTTTVSHSFTVGTWVNFSGVSGAGVVNGVTLNGDFEIIEIVSGTSFKILGATVATSPGSGGGAAVVAKYDINAGTAVASLGGGWGSGPWGYGGWGVGSTAGTPIRLWSQDNDQDNLLFNPRSGAIYYWVKDTSLWSRAVTLNTVAEGEVKVTTTADFGIGATYITVIDPNGIDTGAVITGTGIPAGTYVTTDYVFGSYDVPISAATTAPASGDYTFSYAGKHIPRNTYQIATSSVGNFTIAFGANPYDPTNFSTDFDPLLVRWADADNPFEWVPSTTNQSGENRLSYGSYIVSAVDTRQEILIWTDAALFSMQYLGPPYVFSQNLLMDNISIASPNSPITVNNVTYWMGVDKFYQYTGRVETLPCSLRQYVFNDINTDQLDQVVSGSNEGYNEVWWFYPSANSLVNDRYVVYNHLERIWYYGNLERSCWLDSPLRQYPMAAFSYQMSYLSSAINSSVTILPIIDSASYPNSGVVTIGSEKIYYTGKTSSSLTGCTRGYSSTTAASHIAYSAVTYNVPNQVMSHEYGNDDRSTSTILPIEAYIETSDFDIQDGQSFGYIWRMLPDLTFNGSSSNTPSVTLTVKPRQNSGSAYTAADSPTVTQSVSYPIELYTGQVYTRVRGRQMAFKMSSSDIGVAWQMGMMRIDVRPDGRR
jgi:hypothetical protein